MAHHFTLWGISNGLDKLNIMANFINVINEGGSPNIDFRVEGDTVTHLLFTDASADRVGMGSLTPESNLHILKGSTLGIAAPTAGTVLLLENASDTNCFATFRTATSEKGGFIIGDSSDPDEGQLTWDTGPSRVWRFTAITQIMNIGQSGVVIGADIAPPTIMLQVRDTAEQFRLEFDATKYVSHTVSSAGKYTIDLSVDGDDDATIHMVVHEGLLISNSSGDTVSSGVQLDVRGAAVISGNFGVNDTSPSQKVDVNGIIQAYNGDTLTDPTGDLGDGARFSLNNSTTNPFAIGVGATDGGKFPMWFQTGDVNGGGFEWYIGTSEKMRLDKDGRLGLGTPSPFASAKLEISSTTGALLLTRMTTTQRDALTAVNGMLLYNSSLNKFQGYENGSWTSFI